MRDLGLRAAAFVGFVALLAGSVWAAYAFLAVEGAEVRPLDDAYVVSAGRSFTIPYTLLNTGSQAADLRLVVTDPAGLDLGAPTGTVTLEAFDEAPGWLTLTVPAGTPPGGHVVEIAAVDATGARLGAVTVTVTVAAPQGGAQLGTAVPVWYVGRHTNGTIFDTNVEALGEGPWPKAGTFRTHASWEPLTVQAGPGAEVVPGFAAALEGIHPGESRTVVIPPEEAYGPKWFNQTVPRDVEILRDRIVPLPDRSIQRPTWERHIVATEQGEPAEYAANDTFEIYDELNTYNARIVSLSSTVVVYRFDLNVGEKYSFYDFWPNASEVVSVNETAAVLRTTPNTAPEERFTYFRPWVDMSYVKSMDEEKIVIRSDVPEGFSYQSPGAEGQAPTTLRVGRVTETQIVVETPNPHQLAGETLVFDIESAR